MRDLLLISDLHLGSHLKARSRGEFVHLAARLDGILPRFLDHYARLGTWQLVVNGDFIDFWNVEIGDDRQDPVSLAVDRLHVVLDAYPGVEDALVSFLAAGNSIVFVAGNHDAELLYPEVCQALAERLEGGVDDDDEEEGGELRDQITATGVTSLDEVGAGRVRFVPWFVRDGGAWIEHGHIFDPACSTPAQLSPTRGGRLVKSVAEVATRRFTNLMPEIDYDAADRFTTLDYLRWAAARGWRFALRVVVLYLRMVGGMLALWARGGVDRAGREQHEERLAKLAQNAGLQMSALTALEQMAPPPSSTSVGGVLSVTALDLALAVVLPALLIPLVFWLADWSLLLGCPLGLGLGVLAGLQVKRRRSPRNVAHDMLEVASSVGEVTGTQIVLMGHSHRGSLERRGGVIYGNSGSWLDGSHLVVRRGPDGERLETVELRQWRNGGITLLDTMRVEEADAPAQPAFGAGFLEAGATSR